MNSRILSALGSMFATICVVFKKSGLYHIIDKAYKKASVAWQNSAIMTFLRKDSKVANAEGSVLGRVVNTPFAFFAFLGRKIGVWLDNTIENSILLDFARCFMNNVLALNTRFFGCVILSMLVLREISFLRFSVMSAILAAAGIALVLSNYNITDFLGRSALVRFGMSAIGFGDVSFDIYKEEYLKKPAALVLGVACGAVMGILPLKLALFLPCAFVGLCIILSYPVSGVFFAVAAAPFVPTMALAGLCVLTFASLVIRAVRDKEFKWKIGSVGVGLAFFVLFMFIASLFSFAPAKSIMVWGMYLIFVGFYFVIINTVSSKKQTYALLRIFVIAGVLVSIYGICQYVFGWNTTNAWIDKEMFEEATMRAYSTMENPNVLGEYLLLVIPVAVAFMLKSSVKKLDGWFYAGAVLASVICMVLTQSRGCWLGLILAAAIFVTFYNGRLWALLPIVILALPFVIPETMIDRMMSVGNLEDSSTSYRVFIWRGTFEMLKDFWIGGIGMGEGAFRSVYPIYSYSGIVAPHSHNTFLQLLVEGGIAALGIFVVVMLVFIKKISKTFSQSLKNSKQRLLALAIGSGVIGFLLQSMFDYTFYNYRMMAMFFMILALGTSFEYVKEEQHEDN